MQKDLDYVGMLKTAFERGVKAENLVPLMAASVATALGSLLLVVGAAPFGYAFAQMSLRVSRGERVELGDIWPGTSDAIRAIVAGILAFVAVSIGLIGLVIGALIVAFFLFLTPFLLADEATMSPVDAMKASFGIVRAHIGPMLVVFLISAFLTGLGSALGGVGAIVLMPFSMLFVAQAFEGVKGLSAGQPTSEIESGDSAQG